MMNELLILLQKGDGLPSYLSFGEKWNISSQVRYLPLDFSSAGQHQLSWTR